MLLIVVMYALMAGTFSLGKLILSYSQPIFIVGLRMSIAGFILLMYHCIRYRNIWIPRQHWFFFAQAMLFTIYIPYLLRYWGLVHLPSSKACLIYNCGPFLSYFFSYLVCGETLRIKKMMGLVIGFIGLLPLIFTLPFDGYRDHNFFILPELAILAAVTSMSYGWLMIHRLINTHRYLPSLANGIIMWCGGLLALLTSLLLEDTTALVTDVAPFITLLVIIIVVSNLVCHNLYGNLLKYYTPTMLSFTSFLLPLFAALYGWLFMHEVIPFCFYYSSVIISIGLGLFYFDELVSHQVAHPVRNHPV